MDFRFQIASDVIRDGLGVELIDATGRVCAEVFRCDANNTLTISLFTEDLPYVRKRMANTPIRPLPLVVTLPCLIKPLRLLDHPCPQRNHLHQ
jgi:hypothetical protein